MINDIIIFYISDVIFSLPPSLSGVVLTQLGYYTIPPLSELDTLASEGHCEVENFTVGREGFGKVCFLGVTDVAGLILDDLGTDHSLSHGFIHT